MIKTIFLTVDIDSNILNMLEVSKQSIHYGHDVHDVDTTSQKFHRTSNSVNHRGVRILYLAPCS